MPGKWKKLEAEMREGKEKKRFRRGGKGRKREDKETDNHRPVGEPETSLPDAKDRPEAGRPAKQNKFVNRKGGEKGQRRWKS